MNIKEKANELVDKHHSTGAYGYEIEMAKESALITVNEIIKSEKALIEDLLLDQSKIIAQTGLQYWIEVKEEIEAYTN